PFAWARGIACPTLPGSNSAPLRKKRRFFVRPARAHSWRCKSSRELTTASEAKRNCGRATGRGEEASSETASRWTRTGYEAVLIRASEQEVAKLLWSRIGGVNPAVVQGRSAFLPGEISPCG